MTLWVRFLQCLISFCVCSLWCVVFRLVSWLCGWSDLAFAIGSIAGVIPLALLVGMIDP